MNYNKLNELLYDKNNIRWYLKVKPYSLFDDEINSTLVLR